MQTASALPSSSWFWGPASGRGPGADSVQQGRRWPSAISCRLHDARHPGKWTLASTWRTQTPGQGLLPTGSTGRGRRTLVRTLPPVCPHAASLKQRRNAPEPRSLRGGLRFSPRGRSEVWIPRADGLVADARTTEHLGPMCGTSRSTRHNHASACAIARRRGRGAGRPAPPSRPRRPARPFSLVAPFSQVAPGQRRRGQPTAPPISRPSRKVTPAAAPPSTSWRAPLNHQLRAVTRATTAPQANSPASESSRAGSSEVAPSR